MQDPKTAVCYSKGTVPLKAAAGQRNWQHTHPGDKTGPQKRPPTPHASCTRAHTTVAHTTNMHTARTHTCTRNLDAGVHVLCGNGSSKVWGQQQAHMPAPCILLVQTRHSRRDRYKEGATAQPTAVVAPSPLSRSRATVQPVGPRHTPHHHSKAGRQALQHNTSQDTQHSLASRIFHSFAVLHRSMKTSM